MLSGPGFSMLGLQMAMRRKLITNMNRSKYDDRSLALVLLPNKVCVIEVITVLELPFKKEFREWPKAIF